MPCDAVMDGRPARKRTEVAMLMQLVVIAEPRLQLVHTFVGELKTLTPKVDT